MTNTKDNTPEHCWNCWKFNECEQAQNMMPYTEPVDAYMGEAEFFCADCADKIDTIAPQGKRTEYIGDIGETDSPQHCTICGVPLIHSLTTDGVNYVKEKLAESDGCCQELWRVLYADYLN